jgi:hypothetical protein
MVKTNSARVLTTKRSVLRELLRHGSPYVLMTALAATQLARWGVGGRWGWDDLVAAFAMLALQPFVEWSIHRFVLHAPARRVLGLCIDPGVTHRGHHRAPDDVRKALLGTGYAVADSAGLVIGVGGLAAAGAWAAGARIFEVAATSASLAIVGLGAYEWLHLLVHSGYRGRTAWYHRLRTQHRLHHYRDERSWFGITSRLADRVLGTADPRRDGVAHRPGIGAG